MKMGKTQAVIRFHFHADISFHRCKILEIFSIYIKHYFEDIIRFLANIMHANLVVVGGVV